jgi:hypothetical protein
VDGCGDTATGKHESRRYRSPRPPSRPHAVESFSHRAILARPASQRLYEDSRSVPPHDQAAKRTGALQKGDDFLIFFCVLFYEYAVIETDRDAVIVTLRPTSNGNEIGYVKCQSSDVAVPLSHRMADSPTQMKTSTVAVISVAE